LSYNLLIQICEDVSAIQRTTYRKEEDACKEADAEPGVQRVVRIRGACRAQRRARPRLSGTARARLGQGHQERGTLQ
jgi:hypothetical protein